MNNTNQAQAFINQAISLENQGAFQEAERVYKAALLDHPDSYIIHSRMGALLVNMGRANEALGFFEKARDLKPGDPDILFNSALAYQANNDFDKAISFFHQAGEKGMDKGMVFSSLAEIYEQTNRLEDLKTLLEQALVEAPKDTFLLFTAAKLRRREGQFKDALEFLQRAEKLPGFEEIAMLANFERGRIYDKLDDPARAYHAFQKGNLLSLRQNVLPGMNKKNFLDLIKEYRDIDYSKWGEAVAEKAMEENQNPVFLVGFPRSGTTLLHQILDGHSGLEILEEKPFITTGRGAISVQKGSLSAALSGLTPFEWTKLRNDLLEVYNGLKKKGPETKIIDKLPLHIVDVPLILKMFPDAKFIVALRHPFDCTLSCFMQNFNLNNAMLNFTNLDDTTRFYEEIFSLWLKYKEALNPNFIYVRYEDVVADLEKEARRLIKFLGLDWDPGVLNYQQQALSKKHIATPSYHQVIQPI